MNKEALERHFHPDQIKHRKGNFGNTLAYLEGHTVIQRLNSALDAAWSFEVVTHEVLQDEVLVLGRLVVDGIVKTQFGCSTITRSKSTGELVSLGDDLKAATTDALKKAATLLGVGNYLYAGDPQSPVRAKDPIRMNGDSQAPFQGVFMDNNQVNKKGGNVEDSYHTRSRENYQGSQRLSSKQFDFIHGIARKKGITQKEINENSVGKFGTKVDFLTRKDASNFIEDLLNMNPSLNPRPSQPANGEVSCVHP